MAGAAARPTEATGTEVPAARTIEFNTVFHNTFTEVEMTEIQAVPGPSNATRLAEENQRLLAENQQLKAEQQARQAAAFLAELRAGGQITPAMEQAGLAQALTAAANQPVQVSLPGGKTLPLGDVLREVLRTLPALCPQAGSALTDAALPGSHAASTPAGPGYSLSPTEREVAAKLGLSEQEYAEIKSAG